jgi:transposase-like protein
LVERDGKARSFHVPNIKAETLSLAIIRNVDLKSHFRTDELPAYSGIGKSFTTHRRVRHSLNEYVKGNAYTNTVEGFFSILKRGVYGTYQCISEAHLQRYLSEFDFRYNNREKLGIGDVERADRALIGVQGKRLTYQTTCSGRGTEARSR